MTATSIEFDTRAINNGAFGPPARRDFERINTTLSFYYLLSDSIRTLSTNSASVGSSPEGLLYVPQLDQTDPCVNASAQYVPQNVTRRSDLPNLTFPPVAIAPWLSPQCVQSYLAAGRRDSVRSFVFYLPGQGMNSPPSANDPAWGLSDGGRWKGDNPYPVYAVPSSVGDLVMQQSALYSGPNLTTAPNNDQLVQTYDRNDFAKLYIDINLNVTAGLPSLWIFLVVILAVLISIVGIVSSIMHFLQRRRRQQLRQRVANGEVDLEVIGVKRLLVPREVLDKMPIYRYEKVDPTAAFSSDDDRRSPVSIPNPTGKTSSDGVKIEHNRHNRSPSTVPTNHFDQPTCAICLDDFVANETMVRELPCGHIFHPECVDVFLTQNSSLCPLCKKSALPAGYCPDVITNAMVRRERLIRRARERADRLPPLEGDANQIINEHTMHRHRRRRENADIEMGVALPQQPPATADPMSTPMPSSPTAAQGMDRRERARRRAAAMLGPNAAPMDPEADQQTRTPAWRRGLRKVFPALR
ncbi:Ring finger domain-containing protein 4 [Elsinoe fawcettii]|nr:Ring finger domain-containing protein 4 [Elsinoe fawcettii]